MGKTNLDTVVTTGLEVGGADVAAEVAALEGLTATAVELNKAADVSSRVGTYTATSPAAIPANVQVIELNHASTAIEKTLALGEHLSQLLIIKDISATGTAAHTVTVTGGTLDGTNDVATLNALNECLIVYIDSAGNGTVVENVGTVGLS